MEHPKLKVIATKALDQVTIAPLTIKAPVLKIQGDGRPKAFVEELLGCVYSITNTVENKSYVGQAKLMKYKNGKAFTYGLRGRWSDHCSDAGKHTREMLIHDAIRRLNLNTFVLTVLEIVTIPELEEKEMFYIRQRNAMTPNGYNVKDDSHNRHTAKRIKFLEERYGAIDFNLDSNTRERIRKHLQNDIDDPFVEHFKRLESHGPINRVRIATAKSKTAKRKGGQDYEYVAVVVRVYTDDIQYAKDAIPFRFGGLTITVPEAYEVAMAFARRLPIKPDGHLDDQVRDKLVNFK